MTSTDVTTDHLPADRADWDHYHRPGMALRPAPDRAATPSWKTLRHNLYRNWLDVGPGWLDTPQSRLLDDHRWQGDELMDAVVDLFDDLGSARGRELVEQALAQGISSIDEPPAELIALFEHLDRVPSWYHAERIERGRLILNDVTPLAKLAAGAFGVFATATSQDVSAATGATGRIVEQPVRRAVESNEFFEKITYQGALERDSDIFAMIVRVRLMHSQVRRGLRRSWGTEDFRKHGMPISNSRLAEGSAWFASMPLLVDHLLGRRKTARDHDDVALYWGYILYLFGVEERLIPTTGHEAITLANHIFSDAGTPSKWRPELIESLLAPVADGAGRFGRVAVGMFIGAAATVMGVPTVAAALTGTRFESVAVHRWHLIHRLLGRLHARIVTRTEHIPVIARRRRANATPGDPLLIAAGRGIRAFGRRNGVTDIPFSHHDNSVSGTGLASHQ
ncbi:oxygenase MpaB family protein [Gordonia effusa]|nr:oxygenase MpaB family protein [Gordonia effusa]